MIPKVFVISPSQLNDRRTVTKAHLEALGIVSTMFSGLYGRDVSLTSSRSNDNNVYFKLTPNRISLALNHWFLWQHIIMTETPRAIIFEDDVVLPDDFEKFFDDSMAITPPDWDMIYLQITYPERIEDGRIGAVKVAGNVWKHLGARTWDGACDGTLAYMLTLEGAKKMTSVPFTLNEPIDRWMSFNLLPLMNVYIWHPSVIKARIGVEQWSSTT